MDENKYKWADLYINKRTPEDIELLHKLESIPYGSNPERLLKFYKDLCKALEENN